MHRRPSHAFLQVLLSLFVAESCSTHKIVGSASVQNEKKEQVFPENVHALAGIYFSTLRFRRPLSEGANPKAGPGGVDYQVHPLPNQKYDCEKPQMGLDLAKLRTCLASLKKPVTVLYRLVREPVPLLTLEEADGLPACLKVAAPSLPVPREITFQGNEDGRLSCFSSRLKVEANEVMGVRLPIHKLGVKIELPLKELPKSDIALNDLLTTWVLAPFWSENKGKADEGGVGETLSATLLPDVICRRCMGEKAMLKDTDPPLATWPTHRPLMAPPLTTSEP